jgi:hypothetical protein
VWNRYAKPLSGRKARPAGKGGGLGKMGRLHNMFESPVLPGPVPEPNSVSSLRTATRCCLHGGATRPDPWATPGCAKPRPSPGKAPNSPFANVEWLRHGGGLTPCPTRHRRRAPRGLGLRASEMAWTCHRHEKHCAADNCLSKRRHCDQVWLGWQTRSTKSPAVPGWMMSIRA